MHLELVRHLVWHVMMSGVLVGSARTGSEQLQREVIHDVANACQQCRSSTYLSACTADPGIGCLPARAWTLHSCLKGQPMLRK